MHNIIREGARGAEGIYDRERNPGVGLEERKHFAHTRDAIIFKEDTFHKRKHSHAFLLSLLGEPR